VVREVVIPATSKTLAQHSIVPVPLGTIHVISGAGVLDAAGAGTTATTEGGEGVARTTMDNEEIVRVRSV